MVAEEEKFWFPGLPMEALSFNMEIPSKWSAINFSWCKFHLTDPRTLHRHPTVFPAHKNLFIFVYDIICRPSYHRSAPFLISLFSDMSFPISDPYPDIFLFHKYPQTFIINAIFFFYNVKNPVPRLFSFLHCFAISLHKYEQPLHLILIDITAVLMIFFIQLSKPLFLFLLFFYFSFGCFLYYYCVS